MATEQEYDEIIAPMLADVANRAAELGMSLVARVEWQPGEAGIMQIGQMASAAQIMTQYAALSRGNIDSMLIGLLKVVDCSQSMFLHSYANPARGGDHGG